MSDSAAKQQRSADFESKLSRLRDIADKLENDPTVTLEQSMALYEDGLRITRECVDELNGMQSRIAELNKKLDLILTVPASGEDDE